VGGEFWWHWRLVQCVSEKGTSLTQAGTISQSTYNHYNGITLNCVLVERKERATPSTTSMVVPQGPYTFSGGLSVTRLPSRAARAKENPPLQDNGKSDDEGAASYEATR